MKLNKHIDKIVTVTNLQEAYRQDKTASVADLQIEKIKKWYRLWNDKGEGIINPYSDRAETALISFPHTKSVRR